METTRPWLLEPFDKALAVFPMWCHCANSNFPASEGVRALGRQDILNTSNVAKPLLHTVHTQEAVRVLMLPGACVVPQTRGS